MVGLIRAACVAVSAVLFVALAVVVAVVALVVVIGGRLLALDVIVNMC